MILLGIAVAMLILAGVLITQSLLALAEMGRIPPGALTYSDLRRCAQDAAESARRGESRAAYFDEWGRPVRVSRVVTDDSIVVVAVSDGLDGLAGTADDQLYIGTEVIRTTNEGATPYVDCDMMYSGRRDGMNNALGRILDAAEASPSD